VPDGVCGSLDLLVALPSGTGTEHVTNSESEHESEFALHVSSIGFGGCGGVYPTRLPIRGGVVYLGCANSSQMLHIGAVHCVRPNSSLRSACACSVIRSIARPRPRSETSTPASMIRPGSLP